MWTRLFTLVVQSASRVFLSALKPTRRVTDYNYLDHTAIQHWVKRPLVVTMFLSTLSHLNL